MIHKLALVALIALSTHTILALSVQIDARGAWTASIDGRTWRFGYAGARRARLLKVSPAPTGHITIPSHFNIEGFEGEEYSVVSIDDDTFDGCTGLTGVTIPGTVEYIGGAAFRKCSKLKEVEIPSSVTEISNSAFADCTSLEDIVIPRNMTRIWDASFSGCTHLKNVTLHNGITKIGVEAFASCSSLKEITLPPSVTRIGYRAFKECKSLASISIPDGVTAIEESTFQGCSSLRSVTIPEGVSRIDHGAFMSCSNLSRIRIPNSVTSIGESAFSTCGLEEFDIPESVTKIGWNVFGGCSFLKSVNIGKNVTDGIVGGSSEDVATFRQCFYWPYPRFNVSYENEYLASYDGILYSKDRKTLYTIPADYIAPTIQLGITNIYDYAISCNSYIWHLNIPTGVKNVGRIYNCDSLKEVTIPSSVETITGFYDCTNLTSMIFVGDAPSVNRGDFQNMGTNCTAYVKRTASGFPSEGEDWHGLTVKYYGANVSSGNIIEVEGGYLVAATGGATLSKSDISITAVLGSRIVSTTAGYFVEVADDGKTAMVSLRPPEILLPTESIVIDDKAGILANVNDAEILAKPKAINGEEVGAIMVAAVPGLYYQAAWGDDLGNLAYGEKVQATTGSLCLGVIKQTGTRGFYKVAVSER